MTRKRGGFGVVDGGRLCFETDRRCRVLTLDRKAPAGAGQVLAKERTLRVPFGVRIDLVPSAKIASSTVLSKLLCDRLLWEAADWFFVV